jgi:hypothetical protein
VGFELQKDQFPRIDQHVVWTYLRVHMSVAKKVKLAAR